MSWGGFTELRDTAETAAVLYGNYLLPGSSMVTSKLVSDGSREQLDSDAGQLAQLGTGVGGAANGNLSNWTGGESGGVSGIDLGGPGSGPGWENSLQSGIDLGGPGSSPATLGNGFDFSTLSKAKDAYDAISEAKNITKKSGGSGDQGDATQGVTDNQDMQRAERRQRLMDRAQSLRQRISQLRAQVATSQTSQTTSLGSSK